MSPTFPIRLARYRAVPAGLVLIAACQAEGHLAPPTPPVDPPAHAFYLDIDVTQGTVRVVAGGSAAAPAAGAGDPSFSLAGAEIVGLTISNVYRSPIGQFVKDKRTITFDLALTNRLSLSDLVTPTFPTPPSGVQGVIAFPYSVAASGVQGGKAVPNGDWNGAPRNFFNDFASCGTAVTSDCYRWEAFPAPLAPGQTTGAQKVGFTVDAGVTSVGVYLVVAADLVDHPPPPQPGLGALLGTVSSPQLGPLAGVTLTLTPGGKSASTDGVGKYLITALPVGSLTADLSGLPAGCATPASQAVAITSGGVSTADFTVTCSSQTSGSVSVHVTWPGGAMSEPVTITPANGAQIHAISDPVTGSVGPINVVTGQATVSLDGVPGGCQLPAAQLVSVPSGGAATVDIAVTCNAANLFGSLVSPTLGGLGGVSFTMLVNGAQEFSYPTDAGGNFTAFAIWPTGGSATIDLTVAGGLPVGCAAPSPFAASIAPGGIAVADIAVDCSGAGPVPAE